MSEQPPPLPPTGPPSGGSSDSKTERAFPGTGPEYDLIADKIGFVPNVRKKDNLYQGLAVLGGAMLGALVGWLSAGFPGGMLAGAFCGLVGGLLVSGVVLMVIGWTRKS